ncbi:MAG: rhomboid family intramembrane serine protease [Phycisphaerae bacterium]|jgi:membrane associated rhomboid family serine protease
MLIPIGTDVRPRKPPAGNYILIFLNVAIFLFTNTGLGKSAGGQLRDLWTLYAAVPDLGQYITYQFLHADWMHLAGNMLFLWIFGNAVCDRMGSLCYVLFYLAGGVCAGATFAAFNDNAILGASGSIAAVTTAFLVLFPRVHVTLLLWLIIITVIQVPAMIVIVFKIILWDNVIAPSLDQSAVSSVAYSAHLGGYAFGFAVAVIMLITRALPRNQFDLLALWSRWQRRAGLQPVGGGSLRARPIEVTEVDSRPLSTVPLTAAEQLREEALERLSDGDHAAATAAYLKLLEIEPQQVLPRAAQLEVANYLAQTQRHITAAMAYELFLAAYPGAGDAPQVRLLLGLICARYLHQYERAAMHLRRARSGLTIEAQRAMAESELRQIEPHLSGPPSPEP